MVFSSNRWGDDDDDFLPSRTESAPDANGIRTVIEWKFNGNGEKVKVTKKVRQVNQITRTSKAVLDRRHWEKFGAALNEADNTNVTYTSNEEVSIEDPNADASEKKEQENIFAGVKNSSIVVCRHCGMVGDHWTLKCPYKDTPPDQIPSDTGDSEAPNTSAAPSKPSTGLANAFSSNTGKYVPPSLRGRTEGASSNATGNDESERDNATLRVTNISTETRESDLQELFRTFGPIARIYLAKDRETMQSRGFAFVSFVYREDAERALQQLQGFGYDHLILKLEWAKPSSRPSGGNNDVGSMGTTFRSGYGKALPQDLKK